MCRQAKKGRKFCKVVTLTITVWPYANLQPTESTITTEFLYWPEA